MFTVEISIHTPYDWQRRIYTIDFIRALKDSSSTMASGSKMRLK